PDLVAHTPKHRQPLLVAARRGGGIVPTLAEKAIERLRRVAAQVDADVRHRAHGQRVDAARLGPGARHLEAVGGQAAEQSLRHLAAGGVVRAEEEHPRDAHPRRGFVARTNALMNLPSTCGAIMSASTPLSARNSRASSTR